MARPPAPGPACARALLALACVSAAAALSPPLPPPRGLCRFSFCECSPAAHPSWTTVNCSVPRDQSLDILEGDLPESTTALEVRGAEAVTFGANALARLRDVRLVRVEGARRVLLRRYTALGLDAVSLYLEVASCGVLRVEESAFSNIKGPLTATFSHCDLVAVEGAAFSWLLSMSITDVRTLELSPEAFMLDPTAANVGEHGPGLTIELSELSVPELAAHVFGSSAATVALRAVEVLAVRSGAFSANTYNVVTAVNCSFHIIEGESFAQKSLINNLQFYGCKIHRLASRALQSAVANLNISHSRIENIETGAINATVAAVVILDSEFNNFMERGFELSSWNKFQMERNSFDDLAPHAIIAPGASIHELIFAENEIETANPDSLAFIGQARASSAHNVRYRNNYFGQPCHCNVTSWLAKALGVADGAAYEADSYCTVNEFFARCFNVPEQNMVFKKFLDGVCGDDSTIQCETYKSKVEGEATEIKNPRFPHKNKDQEGLSDRNKKVIGIVIVTVFGCIVIALFVSLVRWMRRKGYCVAVKNFLISSKWSCGSLCGLCACGRSSGLDHAGSISQLSVNEYSERHRLNEPRVQDLVQETALPAEYAEQPVPVEDKTTQTLPEELTKELLENLREKLEDPENYLEAREMIEHLYELIKVEESCNANLPPAHRAEENIYELPFQNTTPRIGKNKKQMISVGTRAPSLDRLLPLSPYNRQTALAHEYFEPKDFAVHLYAEIANCDKEKKHLRSVMPDVVAEQAAPRGPYLRAVRDKGGPSTIRSNKSTLSNSSGRMINRPLPEKPSDAGAGTSLQSG